MSWSRRRIADESFTPNFLSSSILEFVSHPICSLLKHYVKGKKYSFNRNYIPRHYWLSNFKVITCPRITWAWTMIKSEFYKGHQLTFLAKSTNNPSAFRAKDSCSRRRNLNLVYQISASLSSLLWKIDIFLGSFYYRVLQGEDDMATFHLTPLFAIKNSKTFIFRKKELLAPYEDMLWDEFQLGWNTYERSRLSMSSIPSWNSPY